MTEKTLKTYTENGVRVQLLVLTIEDIGSDGMPTSLTKTVFQVRRNRKIRITTESYESACKLFQAIVNHLINQLKLFEL